MIGQSQGSPLWTHYIVTSVIHINISNVEISNGWETNMLTLRKCTTRFCPGYCGLGEAFNNRIIITKFAPLQSTWTHCYTSIWKVRSKAITSVLHKLQQYCHKYPIGQREITWLIPSDQMIGNVSVQIPYNCKCLAQNKNWERDNSSCLDSRLFT